MKETAQKETKRMGSERRRWKVRVDWIVHLCTQAYRECKSNHHQKSVLEASLNSSTHTHIHSEEYRERRECCA